MATNVKAKELNYDRYETEKYDEDIVRSIPGHVELHKKIDRLMSKFRYPKQILELGVGTGLTALRVLRKFPKTKYFAVDFSKNMLNGAKIRLSDYQVKYLLGDFAKIKLPHNNDMVISVIGIHHQETDEDKKELFQKIFNSMKSGGTFIFGDLVTYRNKGLAAKNDALHYHYLVEHSKDKKSLKEWEYHHRNLNKLSPVEDQIDWLKEAGFSKVRLLFQKYNTSLIIAIK